MFTNARIQRGDDEVRGDYISYDAITEFFQVIGGGKTAATPGNPQGRVRAVIQPKPKAGCAARRRLHRSNWQPSDTRATGATLTLLPRPPPSLAPSKSHS